VKFLRKSVQIVTSIEDFNRFTLSLAVAGRRTRCYTHCQYFYSEQRGNEVRYVPANTSLDLRRVFTMPPPAVSRSAPHNLAGLAHRGGRGLALFSIILCGLVGAAEADTLRLAWDPSGSEISSYVVHVGPSEGTYSQHFDVGLSRIFEFTSAVPGQRYCFAVTARANGVSSGFSNEVCGFSNMYPTLAAPAAQRGVVGDDVALLVQGGDPLGDSIAFSAANLPTGLQINEQTGLISGRFLSAGAFIVTVTVSDGRLITSASFRWTVTPPDQGSNAPSGDQPSGDQPSSGQSPNVPPPAGQLSAPDPMAVRAASVHSSTGAVYTGRVAIPRRTNSAGQAGTTGRTTRSTASTRTTARTPVATAASAAAGTAPATSARATSSTQTDASSSQSPNTEAFVAAACEPAVNPCAVQDAATPPDEPTRIADASAGIHAAPGVARVSIMTPVSQARFATGALILFMADAEDALAQKTDRVVWSSSRDGRLGTGTTLLKSLTSGTHTITAALTLDDGSIVRTSITLVVGAAR
jgi:hypothetical protein